MNERKSIEATRSPERYSPTQKAGITLVLLGAVFIALTPSMAKLAYVADANTIAVVTSRCVLAVLGLGAFMVVSGRGVAFVLRDLPLGPLTGAAQALGSLGLLLSVAYIDAGLAFLIVSSFPFLVAVVEHVRGKTRLKPIHVALICFALAGLALSVSAGLGSTSALGIVAAVIGAVATTVMVLCMSAASERTNVIAASFSMMFWASVYFILTSVIGPSFYVLDAVAWPTTGTGWIGLMGTGISFTLGYLLFFQGAQIIGITRASVLSISELVLAILFAMVLLGEWITLIRWVGVALVVGSPMVFEKHQAT